MNFRILPFITPVVEQSQIADVRRKAVSVAGQLHWNEAVTGKLAILVTEAGTNLVKYARRGEIHLNLCQRDNETGIEVLALDHGPGAANTQVWLADGYSTAGTAGTGLGAIERIADEFDLWSQPERGTCLVARLYPSGRIATTSSGSAAELQLGSVRIPVGGEQVCGDNWTYRVEDDKSLLLVADGLGHGIHAAEASGEAVKAFHEASGLAPLALLERIHLALRPTRGAAVAIAQIDPVRNRLEFGGIGNISAMIIHEHAVQHLVSHNGTAGHNLRKAQTFSYRWPSGAILIMHSDGINTSWRLDSFPGLAQKHPSVIAGVLAREASRGRDDVCVVVGRARE